MSLVPLRSRLSHSIIRWPAYLHALIRTEAVSSASYRLLYMHFARTKSYILQTVSFFSFIRCYKISVIASLNPRKNNIVITFALQTSFFRLSSTFNHSSYFLSFSSLNSFSATRMMILDSVIPSASAGNLVPDLNLCPFARQMGLRKAWNSGNTFLLFSASASISFMRFSQLLKNLFSNMFGSSPAGSSKLSIRHVPLTAVLAEGGYFCANPPTAFITFYSIDLMLFFERSSLRPNTTRWNGIMAKQFQFFVQREQTAASMLKIDYRLILCVYHELHMSQNSIFVSSSIVYQKTSSERSVQNRLEIFFSRLPMRSDRDCRSSAVAKLQDFLNYHYSIWYLNSLISWRTYEFPLEIDLTSRFSAVLRYWQAFLQFQIFGCARVTAQFTQQSEFSPLSWIAFSQHSIASSSLSEQRQTFPALLQKLACAISIIDAFP